MASDDPIRVAILSGDPLVRAGLAARLEERNDLELADDPEGADAVLLDAREEEAVSQVESSAAPVVAIVGDVASARTLLASGAAGAIRRASDPDAIAAALRSAAHGLVALDRDYLGAGAAAIRDTDSVDPLTARELQVLELLAGGFSNKEIARRLEISEHTAKFHISAILGKLGAATRTEAVVTAARRGLLVL